MRRLVFVLILAGCRSPGWGTGERAAALLADYSARRPEVFPSSSGGALPFAVGQFTVHAVKKNDRVMLERVAVIARGWVSIEQLGDGEPVRVKAAVEGSRVLEAWSQHGAHPEVHFDHAVPAEVQRQVISALGRGNGRSGTITVPAGTFEGCTNGRHAVVPISGVVRTEEDGVTRELVDFGDDGSGSLF